MPFYVKDLNIEDCLNRKYHAAFFCSGYEKRCTHLPEKLEKAEIDQTFLLGFTQLNKTTERLTNDDYFTSNWKSKNIAISGNDDSPVFEILQSFPNSNSTLRILVDYSSMSRLWYAAIINWARFESSLRSVEIDFIYSVGSYEAELIPIVINDMLAIPGCEGGPLRFDKAIAIFGLGFYGMMADCVLENLQPDSVFAFVASPGASPEYGEQVLANNKFLLSHSKETIYLPLDSVESSFRHLAEIAIPELPESEVVLIPMGPKPHVLASLLVAMRYADVSCLRVSAKRMRPEQVVPTGRVIATNVIFGH